MSIEILWVCCFETGALPKAAGKELVHDGTISTWSKSRKPVVAFFGRMCLQVDGELNTLLMRLPNLLDSRVPDGDGEEENMIVSEWGQEYVKTGEVCELNYAHDSRRSVRVMSCVLRPKNKN